MQLSNYADYKKGNQFLCTEGQPLRWPLVVKTTIKSLMQFKDNQKLTLIFVDPILETTVRREIKFTRVADKRPVYIVRGRNPKKEYYFEPKHDMLVFDGWGLPISIDSDSTQFKANGAINFETNNLPQLKRFIDSRNVNTGFTATEKIMCVVDDNNKRTYKNLYTQQ